MLPDDNPVLKRYKELYSKYVESRVNLHNYHITFIKYHGRESSVGVRKSILEMTRLEKELRIACRDVYKENIAWEKSQKKIKKQQKIRNITGLKGYKPPTNED